MSKRELTLFLITAISAIFLMRTDCLYASEISGSETLSAGPFDKETSDVETSGAETSGEIYVADMGTDVDDAWYLDPMRTCSLTVHAYVNQSGEESPGTWAEGQSVPMDAVPLKGAVYSYLKIGDITQIVSDHTAGVYICHVNTDILRLIADNFEIAADRITEDGETCYTVGALQDALYQLLVNDTGAKNDKNTLSAQPDPNPETGEDALTRYIAEKGTAMQPTGNDGTARADDLAQGLYLLAETELPTDDNAEFFSGTAPAFLMLPQMDVTKFTEDGKLNASDNVWLYDISVYPKNRELQSGKKIVLDHGSACADADDRESGSMVTYVSYINLPVPGEGGEYDFISMKDTMTEGLEYSGMTGIFYGPWLTEEDPAHAVKLCHGELLPDADYIVVQNDRGFSLELTPEGLDKVNSLSTNGGIYVFYNALVTRDASIGTSGTNLNESCWTISTERTSRNYSPAPARATIALYGIDLLKKGLPDPSKARFEVLRDKQLLCFDLLSDGIYMLTGTGSSHYTAITASETMDEPVSALSPGKDGHLLILGLDQATYTLRETKTQQGYSLLLLPFDVTLIASPVTNGSLEKAELVIEGSEPVSISLSAANAGIAEFSISNEGVIMPLMAGDDDYWKVAAFIALSGIVLLIALLVRRHRLNKETEHFTL